MMLDSEPVRSSLQVAPLAISSSRSGSLSASPQDDGAVDISASIYSQLQITPPSTPNESQEDVEPQQLEPSRPVFYNFLRAFYPFQPVCTVTDSTITLPLDEGDVVLVHSIHTNGWADGTLLATGARGWLPTNYCEAYDPEEMRNLLKALLNFWDLLRSTITDDQDIFENQEFMKGIIAGVRYLLERTHCLTRETATIQRCESLRRGRKGLLSELSLLVKTAKRLQGMLRVSAYLSEEVNNVIDEMILRAFKVVVRGVRFIDLLEEERRTRAPTVTVMATVMEESFVLPTPPAESISIEEGGNAGCQTNTGNTMTESPAEVTQAGESTSQRLSYIQSPAITSETRISQRDILAANRLSASITHRVSFAGRLPSAQSPNLISEQLNSSHDAFLSHLSSLIGRLRLQSLSRSEFALAIRLSTTSGGALWAVVNVVCDHNTLIPEPLESAHAAMSGHICDLVSSAGDILKQCDVEAEQIVIPQDDALQHAAIHCVKTAGECVARTKWVLEKIGDFEFEVRGTDFGLDLEAFETAASESRPHTPERKIVDELKVSPIAPPATSLHLSIDKPLPEIPSEDSLDETNAVPELSSPSSRPRSILSDASPSVGLSSVPLSRPLVQPLPKLSTALVPEESYSPTEVSHDIELHSSFRSDTGTATSTGTGSSYLSRDSESSVISQSSTRATTPDSTQIPRNQPSLSDLSTTCSTALTEEVEEVESRLLEKTYVHELMLNKDGQVVGGSLPALVERLTTHETTPDAMFVSAFYLTFRLFCTPTELVEVLVERFDYVEESPTIAGAVRLRVYNVFKGWLESHWRESSDGKALPSIAHFAEFKLGLVIPSAGKRLTELVQRVTSSEHLALSRLVSTISKPSTSTTPFVPADVTLPTSVLSKSQQGLLTNWKTGGSLPSILDFDCIELARQITLKQMSIFSSIKSEELLGSQWMKNGGADSPNVKAMSGFSNDLSNLVADTILQFPEVKKRAAMIKQWIKIAHQCLELNNYDGLMAIVCSLNSSVISRLRKTWDLLSHKRRELFKTLYAIVEPTNNNKVLRSRLQGHVPPCLPFLGMFLTDLTFVDIGNPATKQLPGVSVSGQGMTVINFDKHNRTAKIIGDLQRFQIPYRMIEVPDMQEWLQAQIVRIKELDQSNVQVSNYRKSVLLEPRETALRTPIEGPTSTTQPGAKADIFGWISRDRHNNHTAVAI
ncbi:ras guanine nucleotide exchange factor domain-containing protein [Astrocystis sublimbata]|nr:ras guanine nucleotide exchange factor domain-containing protein [Astrocystis sublimbata]